MEFCRKEDGPKKQSPMIFEPESITAFSKLAIPEPRMAIPEFEATSI
jgi:hypothetical protein